MLKAIGHYYNKTAIPLAKLLEFYYSGYYTVRTRHYISWLDFWYLFVNLSIGIK